MALQVGHGSVRNITDQNYVTAHRAIFLVKYCQQPGSMMTYLRRRQAGYRGGEGCWALRRGWGGDKRGRLHIEPCTVSGHALYGEYGN